MVLPSQRCLPPLRLVLCLAGLGALGPVVQAGQDSLVAFVVTPQAQPYEERHRATYRLSKNLAAEDVAALLEFLARPPAADSVRESELRSLKNNVADALIAQNKPEAGLLRAFLGLAASESQDAPWREYLLQKIPDLALRFEKAETREQAVDFLRAQTASTEYIFAGTSLISLQRLGAGDPSLIGPVEIARRAQAILDHPRQANACKLAALQVLGGAEPAEGRRRAFLILGDEASPIMLKVSALATLGEHGQAEDAVLVKQYTGSPDYRLRTAAKAAIAKLAKRHPMPAEENEAG
jgi:hypothetical protein